MTARPAIHAGSLLLDSVLVSVKTLFRLRAHFTLTAHKKSGRDGRLEKILKRPAYRIDVSAGDLLRQGPGGGGGGAVTGSQGSIPASASLGALEITEPSSIR